MIARVKFTKTGSSKFIGHLDLLRYFQKAFRRAKLDLTYSQGFSPHPLITFAAPLGVGLTSQAEYLDVTLNSCDEPVTMIDRINEAMANNIRVIDFVILPDDSKNAMSVVAAADYLITLKIGYEFLSIDEFQNEFRKFYNQNSIKIIKKTKKSEMEIDLKPLIYKYGFSKQGFDNFPDHGEDYSLGDDLTLYVQLATGSVNNIKSDLLLETFCDYSHMPYNEFAFQTHRLEIYADVINDKINPDSKKLLPLYKMYD